MEFHKTTTGMSLVLMGLARADRVAVGGRIVGHCAVWFQTSDMDRIAIQICYVLLSRSTRAAKASFVRGSGEMRDART